MNEPDFEQELRGLKPIRPSRELESKIARELAPVATSRSWSTSERRTLLERLLPALGWSVLGAAAAVVAMLSMNLAKGGLQAKLPIGNSTEPTAKLATPTPTNSAVAQTGMPASSTVTGDVLEANDEGLFDGVIGVARRVRYSSVERRSWQDASGAVTMVEVPREDVVVVPVSVQ